MGYTQNMTERTFPLAGASIRLAQNNDEASRKVGEVVWDASYLLAKYVETRVPVSGKKVVEVGAGCGLVGLTATLLGGETIITDRSRELEMAKKNIALNQATLEAKRVVVRGVKTMELQWGKLEPAAAATLRPPVDLILGADVLYYGKAVPLLLTTLKELSGSRTTIYICNKWRGLGAEERFVQMAEADFHVRRIPPGHLDQDLVAFQDIRVYRLRLKSPSARP